MAAARSVATGCFKVRQKCSAKREEALAVGSTSGARQTFQIAEELMCRKRGAPHRKSDKDHFSESAVNII